MTISSAPIFGPYPDVWAWAKARQRAGRTPVRQGATSLIWQYLTEDDWKHQAEHVNAWTQHRKREAAKQRAAERKTLPHPNWNARRAGCAIGIVEMPKCTTVHHGRWERVARECGKRVVAWDVTDQRAVGYLWGACAQHLERALADDLSRVWRWNDGRSLDREADDIEAECTVLALAGR